MRRPIHLGSTSLALHRVFVAPVELPSHAKPASSIAAAYSYRSLRLPSITTSQVRQYSAPQRRLPRDEEIQSRFVRLVDEAGKLQTPIPLNRALSDLDRSTHWLVQVSEGDPETGTVCKIIDKARQREVEKARAKAARAPQRVTKTLELNWAIDGNDLQHRLEKMQEFLEKGNRVEITLAPKRKGRKATLAEAVALMSRIRKTAADVETAKERQAMDGKVLGLVTMYFDGSTKART